ncbi:ankyrin repeat-containing domain protein [Colletotrichum godetiae]|uniref:Ankyrin repeat-containing domain protein n=1 Tax=Colletotrichum godetiae TaxID=1209918 RepID=A0AAJ0EMX7_9PEZI|nr:ankyrin repeat-containing domain protein [Colletotrichum godetiae]KAK1657002.1 ankyrin repeat-containing domain protein [Colletotrichum godetiae]
MTSATEWHLDKLLAPDITTYLGKLTRDQPSSSSQLMPLHIASATGLDAVVKQILKETPAEVVSKDVRGRTPLFYAVQCPLTRSSTIQLLLQQQTDVDGKTVPENQPELLLEHCCRKGLFRLATCFLEHKVRHDLQHLLRLALLALTASLPGRSSSDRAVLIRRLIRHGANPNGMVRATDVDVDKRPLLLEMALTSHSATKRLLAIRGADVNIQDKYGHTALSWLLLENHSARKTVALLLKCGAKLQPRSLEGIIRDTTFRTHQELVTLLSRRENTFELFRLLYKHCNSHAAKGQTEVNFLASMPRESAILARMSDRDINDIRKGNVFPISPYFDLILAPKSHHGSQGQRQQDVVW